MKAMILAAGLGTRLRPVTYTLPKPMVPLCNQPLIGWAAESLIAAGIADLIVNLHHLPESIERYLPAAFPQTHFHFSFEEEILGTGGALVRVRGLLEGEADFVLVNGDTVQFPRYHDLRAARQRRNALAALTLRHPPAGDHFTAVWYEEGAITGFGEGRGEALMFSGAHAISSRVFDDLPPAGFSSIVDEVYRPIVQTGREVLAAIVDDGTWFDIGTPQRYMGASRSLLQLMVAGSVQPRAGSRIVGDSLMHESARGTVVRSAAGARSTIEGTVRDSVIWENCRIGPRVSLDSCIITNDVEIAGDASYSRAMICRADPSIPRNGDARFENDLVIVSI